MSAAVFSSFVLFFRKNKAVWYENWYILGIQTRYNEYWLHCMRRVFDLLNLYAFVVLFL